MKHIHTTIPEKYWAIAKDKGITWSYAIVCGIKALTGDLKRLEEDNTNLKNIRDLLEKKLQEANDVLDKKG